MVTLTLGPVTFTGFEIPESIPTGGQQALAVHKLIGGTRQIDAMGADHRDIAWSGRFRGFNATTRARQLDGLRIAGNPLTLTWDVYRYTVVIQSFEAEYLQQHEIPYSINCVVQADQVSPVVEFQPGLDEILQADLARLTGLPITPSGVTNSITALQSVAAAVGQVRTASKGGIQSLVGAVSAAQTSATAAISTVEGSLGVSSPSSATAMAAQLSGQAAAFNQLDQLYQASSVLGRMRKNLSA